MTKYSFLVYHENYPNFLEDIRGIGVLHLVEREKDVSDSTLEKYVELKSIGDAIKFLSNRNVEKSEGPSGQVDGKEAYEEVLKLEEELENKRQQLALLRKEMNYATPWGDFSVETINKLKENGFQVKFFAVSARKFDPEWVNLYPLEVVGQQGGSLYLVAILPEGESLELDIEDLRQPERPIKELEFYQAKINEDIDKLNQKLDDHSKNSIKAITKFYFEKKENLHYEKALFNTAKEADEKVMLLEGWVPKEKKVELGGYLDKNNILFIEARPGFADAPPVLLKNKKFSEKFEAIGELYSLPSYSEMDLTPFFAPFYLIFFGFCLGDVGYGLLLAVGSIFAKRKVTASLKPIMSLVFYLGLSTIVFGMISGTFFGIPLYETSLPVYRNLAANFKAQGTDINQLMFSLALIFGGIQIIFGLFLKAINEIRMFGWGFAIGTIGWITLILGGVAIGLLTQVAGLEMASLKIPLYILLVVCGILILPLNNLGRNILLNTGIGLWNTYNMITGLLGDLLSYIRLFALGISSAIMGYVFNSLAVNMSGSIPVLSAIVMVVILIVGHSINLFMSGLGAFVHPLRLTFVEFYKNAGFIGGGKKYEPFKKFT